MAKLKTPLLGFGAEGTVGEALTFQRYKGLDVAREKPVPRYRFSLRQAYQRWMYQDYLERWKGLSYTEKRVYSERGGHRHNTAIGEYQREMLTTLPDIAARWRLDEISGATAFDTSLNSNHGTIFGATPVAGLIDGARYFDGINDRIVVPHHATLSFDEPFTVMASFVPTDITHGLSVIVVKNQAGVPDCNYMLYVTTNTVNFVVRDAVGFKTVSWAGLVQSRQYRFTATWDGTDIHLYVEDELKASVACGTPITNTDDVLIGTRDFPASPGWAKGIIDHVQPINRCLTLAEVALRAPRRWPV